MEVDYVLKIVVVGEFGTGKTSLIDRYIQQTFNDDYRPTLGTNISIKQIAIDDTSVNLIFWDIAGQEKWKHVRSLYYKGSNAALVVGDLTQKSTFDAIATVWVPDLRQYAGNDVPVMLIANKNDLNRDTTPEDVEACATAIGAIGAIETSAKTGDNVEDAFVRITRAAIESDSQR
ncbi:MAG TPA: Rab family GTPase [Candidatus Lokiarchaeia archaeon]|nr:Rab family GTPase [Candidatus Lokiarchaeia archaeon]